MFISNFLFLINNFLFFYDYNFFNNKLKLIYNNIILKIIRVKWQVKYLINNWIYSTNHKRISINYFWFVLLAGIVGMVLATIIRIEMAYPGIGILAGDNSQYLSIVTAHGIIMVFFMAMPLLFGFFTNFLFPTQLGVHDVAFPRMNSAAFWFLPASLIILCQLVCIDRRYNRMNCFSIKELQSVLRNKFFKESLNYNLFNNKFNESSTGIKYKLNFLNLSNSNIINNFNLLNGLYKNNFNSSLKYKFNYNSNFINSYYYLSNLIYLENLIYKRFNNQDSSKYSYKFKTGGYMFKLPNNNNLMHLENTINNFTVQTELKTPMWFINLKINSNLTDIYYYYKNIINFYKYENSYNKFNKDQNIIKDQNNENFINLNNFEINLFSSYYYNDNKFSDNLIKDYKNDFVKIYNYCNPKNVKNWYFLSHYDIFFFYNLINNFNFFNFNFLFKWSSINNLDNYFSKLFYSQIKQHNIINNWRFLKFQREGWRCRLLSVRNQNSFYRRYINDPSLSWVLDRNSKDVLPGWALITPFSSRLKFTVTGKVDIGVIVVTITLIASMVSGCNFLITFRYLSTLNNRKMRDARSFFSEAIIATVWMTVAANPMLILGLIFLISDRHWNTSFFDYSGGGDVVLFQHMFWFFGHPEVYIIIIPCFGLLNTMFSFYLRKRISARASLLYSMYTIAFLGFFVWGHHMYMVGLAHTTRMLYSTLTVMISVPAATKIMHWMVTFVNSSLHLELPLVFSLTFIFFFLSGGISGMAVAHTGMDVLFHDTFYVIGHFHVMLAGSLMFAGFGAFYFYLPAIFGIKYNKIFAYLHYLYYTIGQIFTVIPMIWLGYSGMPRRVLDYPSAMGGWHSLSTSAHILSIAGIFCFIIMLFDSIRKKKSYTIKTFGIGRYNTRLNFYLYEVSRNRYWFMKSNFNNKNYLNNNIYNIKNYEIDLIYYYIKNN